ncbi:MAG: TetR/AcrR family transcriptional regulator [Peptostreptococcaceae bacterium]
MMEIKYSQKEILIFEGFGKLVDEGFSLNNIKVSDIAKAAGIGKGTIYEYFKTKEEVIAKSICYKMNLGFANIVAKSDEEETFEEKCKKSFEEIMKFMSSNFHYFQVMITNKEIQEIMGLGKEENNEIVELRNYVLSLLDPTISLGIQEGIINSDLDTNYIKCVFISVCSGISTIINFKFGKITQEDIVVQKDIAYTMLVKALS